MTFMDDYAKRLIRLVINKSTKNIHRNYDTKDCMLTGPLSWYLKSGRRPVVKSKP